MTPRWNNPRDSHGMASDTSYINTPCRNHLLCFTISVCTIKLTSLLFSLYSPGPMPFKSFVKKSLRKRGFLFVRIFLTFPPLPIYSPHDSTKHYHHEEDFLSTRIGICCEKFLHTSSLSEKRGGFLKSFILCFL